ncbi:hypothetical protein D3C73_735360 [compost metagenome]
MAEHAVMLPDDFIERVLRGFQEVVVCRDHSAFGGELDYGHGAAKGGEPALVFVVLVDSGGNVGGHLDHAAHLAVGTQHRHVAGFEPDLLAALVQAQESAADRFAPGEITPQPGVLLAAVKRLFTEYPVMFAAHFFGTVSHGLAKILVGLEDDAIGGEFNHRH